MTHMAVTRNANASRQSRAPRVRMPVRKSRGGGSVLGLRLFDRLFERTRRGAAARAARTTLSTVKKKRSKFKQLAHGLYY